MKKNISFYIVEKRTDKRGLAPIYGQVTINSKNYPFQVEKIKPRYWNRTKQRVNKNRENEPYNRHTEINELLERFLNNSERFNRFDSYREPAPRDEVKKIFFQVETSVKNFNAAYDEFIEANRKKVKYNTTKGRNTARKFIKRFEKYSGIEIQFSDLNLQFFEKLYDFAIDIEELENNTFAAYVAKFKTFLKWANEKGYYQGTEYKKFTFTEKEKTPICLNIDEFNTLFDYDFENDRLNKAKDLYCFGCLTGLRFSDIATLRYEHFQGDYILKTITKTTETDRIPILPQAKELIEKHNTGSVYPLPKISNQKLNDYIKECCQIVGIDTPTIKNRYRGTEIIPVTKPKHEWITVHSARKTYISILIDKGVDPFYIKRITGHKKEATFDKYVKLNEHKIKDEVFKAWEKTTESKKLNFTAVIEKNSDGVFDGKVLEVPKARSQAKTIKELTTKLLSALETVFENQRKQTLKQYNGKKILKRKLNISG
jgi:integrase/predicted RNase H-like HicB family nuclease